jgi:hypothetical protein
LAENEKSLAQEYKDLNVKINKLKSELNFLVKEDKKVNIDKSVEIAAKQKELTTLEEERKKNRESSKQKTATAVTAIKGKKTQSELKKIDEEIAFIERTGNIKPIVAQERKTPGLSPLGESGRAEPGLGQDFGVVAATDEYLNTLKAKRDKIVNKPTDTTVAPTATVSGYGAPLTTQGRGAPVVKYIDNVADLASIEPTSVAGVFGSEVGEETIFLPSVGKQVSQGITLNQFTNNIWGLSSAAVVEYKKAIGYKDRTGVVTSDFANTLIKRVLPVSEANYRNAMNNKPSASWEELVINPTKYTQYVGSSLAGGGAGAVSAQDIKVKSDSIKIYATDLGIGLDDATANKLAREWAAGNYDATTIKPQIARSGKIDFNKGSAAEQLNSLRELAGSYGMQFDEGWFNTAATNILTAKDDVDTYKEYIRDQAKSKFPTLSAQLDQGFTVRQLASPYIQTMSNILEIDPNTIGLNDIYVNQALTGLNDKGEPSTKPLWQFEQDLRKDPRWNYTKNAQDSLMGTARKVLQDFGLVS